MPVSRMYAFTPAPVKSYVYEFERQVPLVDAVEAPRRRGLRGRDGRDAVGLDEADIRQAAIEAALAADIGAA